MVESIIAMSLFGCRPGYGGVSGNDVSLGRKLDVFPSVGFRARRVLGGLSVTGLKSGVDRFRVPCGKASSVEAATEIYAFREEKELSKPWDYRTDDRKDSVWLRDNKADDPSLNNPLLRQERMGCGWLGAIFEWEGVIVEENPDHEKQAWLALSKEEGKSSPPVFMLKRIEGMKTEHAISEVLCWSRDPSQLKRMASRKEEIYQALQGGVYRLRLGSEEFVNVLMHYQIPMALVSMRPKKTLEIVMGTIGLRGYFSAIVTAEDVHRGKPDPEMFVYAAQLLKFIPERCIVFGNSNQTVEAAHDARMKCVAVASKHPVYELNTADLVVRYLDELSVVDLKNLADIETVGYEPEPEPKLELELEDEIDEQKFSTAVDDSFW